MLKVTSKGSKQVINLAPKKRGRPPKNQPSVLATMQNNDDPDIRFVRDLTVSDRTEILEGKDPNFRYRWCEESKLRTREYQGYTKVTDPNVLTHFDGNYMPAEGFDRRMSNKGRFSPTLESPLVEKDFKTPFSHIAKTETPSILGVITISSFCFLSQAPTSSGLVLFRLPRMNGRTTLLRFGRTTYLF